MLRRSVLASALASGLVAPDARAVPGARAATEARVTIDNFTFSPVELTVAAGTRVTWTNRDDMPHAVVDSDDPHRMSSPPLDTGDSFAFTFEQPGVYRYFCALHPQMQGAVTVQ